jgi:glycosyltransferase involved in cell wall biosynthesis
MRILVVADHFPPASGGLAVQAERLSARLGERGHEVVTVAVSGTAAHETRRQYELYRLPVSLARLPGAYQEPSNVFHPPWPDPQFRGALAPIVRDFRPHVAHVHGWSAFSVASLPSPRPPIVVTVHDYGLLCPKKSLMRHGDTCVNARGLQCVTCDSEAQPTPRRTALSGALTASVPFLARRVQRWLSVSHYVAMRHERLPLIRRRMQVVRPLVDLPAASDAPPRQPPYILYVGAGDENPDKGRSTLLRAFESASLDGHELVLVGGRGRVSAPRIDDRGYLRGADLLGAFRGATVTVVPSRWPDPCPAVAVEALACGRPVVASAMGGLTEIVEDGRTGLLVPPDDERALASALTRVIRDDPMRAAMSAAARESVEPFATEVVLSQHEEIYDELVNTHAHPDRQRAAA